jgi:hypothetical protein
MLFRGNAPTNAATIDAKHFEKQRYYRYYA